LPKKAWEGEGFELTEIGAQRAEAVGVGSQLWAARVDDGDKTVARRVWSTEVVVGSSGDTTLVGVRLTCTTRGPDDPFDRSIPSLVRLAAEEIAFELDGRPVTPEPWHVTPDEVPSLVRLLVDVDRNRPVLVATLPRGVEDPAGSCFPIRRFCRLAFGAAHGAVLGEDATYRLSEMLGRDFAVYNGAARTYQPGFDPGISQPFHHPLAMPARMEHWSGGPAGFSTMLLNKVLASSVAGTTQLERALPSYGRIKQQVRQQERALERSLATTDEDKLELLELELREKEEEQEELYEIVRGFEQERNEADQRRSEVMEQKRQLRARNEYLLEALKSAGSASDDVAIPDSLEELQAWGEVHLSGSVYLHARAIRAAKKSPFADVRFVYQVLLMLRDVYVPMRRFGGDELCREFEQELDRLRIEDCQTFGGEGAGAFGDTYRVDYSAQRRDLDRHLKGSSSRDPRKGFRLYYFWDDEAEQVVVGSLPNHLRNMAS